LKDIPTLGAMWFREPIEERVLACEKAGHRDIQFSLEGPHKPNEKGIRQADGVRFEMAL
jgi:hypothetical protein